MPLKELEQAARRPFSAHAIHLVRTSMTVNVQLSQMADQKASILMGATFVVFTISVGQARAGQFSLPLSILAITAFMSAMCAVFAILPSIRSKPMQSKNILFFGVFSHMPEDEFVEQVLDNMCDDETTFATMLRDIHQNGMVLQHKKYRYLGMAYRLFLGGLVLTMLAFLVEHVWRPLL